MLTLKIISTVFIGLSFITTLLKNNTLFSKDLDDSTYLSLLLITTIYGWLWRVLVIVTIWLL